MTQAQVDPLLDALQQYFAQFSEQEDEALLQVLLPHLTQGALSGAQHSAGDLQLIVDWSLVNDAAVQWAKAQAATLVSQINDTTRQNLATAIGEYVNTPGANLQDLMDDIQMAMPANDARAELIAQTEITRAYAQGNLAAWQGAGILKAKRWNTNNDGLVCDICAPLNRLVIGIDEQFDTSEDLLDAPPAHPGCRCWLTPVVRDEDIQ